LSTASISVEFESNRFDKASFAAADLEPKVEKPQLSADTVCLTMKASHFITQAPISEVVLPDMGKVASRQATDRVLEHQPVALD
jgi:hypothetical protein